MSRCPMSMHHAGPSREVTPLDRSHLPRLLTQLDRALEPTTGFLPARTPLRTLPAPFDALSDACDELAERYHGPGKDVRPWLDARFAEPLDLTALDALDDHELLSVMTQTSILCHAYRWQCMPALPENYRLEALDLPAGLDGLWTELAHRLEVPRVGLFATMVCNNWSLRSRDAGDTYVPEDLREEDFDLQHTWLTGTAHDELRTFVFAALGAEALGLRVADQIRRIYRGILAGNTARVTFGLRSLERVLDDLVRHFNTQIRRQKIRPHSFMTLLQPTMIWMIDHGDGPLEGASGPQCCTVQLIDNVLGVPRKSSLGPALLASRRYMLPHHRELVEAFDGAQHILQGFVARAGDPELTRAYNACLSRMNAWRRSHQARGAMYLRGEKGESVPDYASTGMVVELDVDRVDTFRRVMQDHADENEATKLPEPGPTESFGHLFLGLAQAASQSGPLGVHVAPGQTLVRRGTFAPGLFLIEEGRVGVYRDRNDPDSLLAELGPGDIVGEISLLENVPATADVVAHTGVVLNHLTVDEVYELISQDPRAEAAFYRNLARVLASRVRGTSLGRRAAS